MPLAGKTILSFIVDQLADAGIEEFIFVTGYLGEKIQDYVDKKYANLRCHFVQQNMREGPGQAIALTRDIVQGDEVFIVMGDTICEFDIQRVLAYPGSTLGIKKVDDPRHFGVVEMDDQQRIIHVVEKPQIPRSNMALVGIYKIKESGLLYECLEGNYRNKVKSHDEYHLTDALECMIRKGVSFDSFKVANWFDCGRKETLLESNATLLKKQDHQRVPDIPYENTIIVPPVSIAEGCNIKNSIIGPNVAIGENTAISYSIIKNSIIGSYTHLRDVVLSSSLVGNDANIRGLNQSLNIGDNTEIDFG